MRLGLFGRAAALSLALSAGVGGVHAAEFEVVDKLSSNGYAVFKASAEVRGLLGISTGTPYAALDVVSTGTAHTEMAQIWRAGDGVIKGSMSATGVMQAVKFIGDGSTLTGVSTDTLKIGDSYGGGIVFWVDAKGRNALIAPTADQSLPSIQWAPTTGFTGAGLEGVYAGKANTVMISTRTGPGSYAARLCQDYAATVGGIYYDDWYLPSKTELQLLYAQKDVVGGFTTGAYWSSTEYVPNTTNAWYVDFSNGNVSNYFKTSPNYVRCVRGGPFSAFDHSRDAETVRNGAYVTSTQTFTGGNTFALGVTASSYTATGIGVQAAQLRLDAAPDVVISSEASAALGAGVRVSTNVYIVGFSSAAKYYGDGSGLTNLPQGAGDDLGNHIATTTLNMSSFNMVNVSSVNFRSNVFITSAPAAQQGGVYVSTNMFVAGISTATRYYGDGSTLTGVSTNTLKIGDSYGGGIVFWVDSKGQSALISAAADQSTSIKWAPTTAFTGAQADGVGAGKANTVMIATTTGPGNYAARICADYAVTVSGAYYDDWYLPSVAELQLLAGQKAVVGGFSSTFYWSSTERASDTTLALAVTFLDGSPSLGSKTSNYYLRCVRGGPVSAFDYSRDAETVRNGAYVTSTQTFTGGNTFQMGVTASSFTATDAALGVGTAKLRFTNDNIIVSSASAARYGGIYVSTNVYLPAGAKFYGDGSGLTNLPAGAGDNLGNHVATTTLQMGAYGINTSSNITAARYQINGSTVLSILPGADNLFVGVNAGRINTGTNNSFVGSTAGNANAAGAYNAFMGFAAGVDNNAGGYNAFFGANAGAHSTTGGYNAIVGYAAGYYNAAASNNAILGDYSGFNNTASHVSFVGSAAGYYNTGIYNAFFGDHTGHNNTSGEHNVFVGSFAGNFNQTGSYNSIFGHGAGGYGSGAANSFSNSTIMGYQAGYYLTTGSNNIFLGRQAGYATTSGLSNIVLGYDQRTSAPTASNELNIGGVLFGKLDAKTIGISTRAPQAALDIVSTGTADNIWAQIWRNSSGVEVASMTSTGKLFATLAVSGAGDNLGNHVATMTLTANYGIITTTIAASTGTFSGYVNAARYLVNNSTVVAVLPGYKSFAIGINAGISNGANADYNLFVGEQAGEANVTGDDNAFFGYKAGFLNTASDNTFVGYEVGYSNISGFSNVFVGHQAGFSNETGSDNTFVGKYAGGNGDNGNHSSLFGSNAGYANSGDNNSFVGSSAGHDNTTGANNSLLGYQAGSENRTGSANSIFGAQAGYGVSANSYSSSTLMGYKAGFAVTTGSDNLLLGFQTGDSLTTGSRNIIIGYDEDAPLATTNDYINIGGLLHGDMAQSSMTVYGNLYADHFYGDISGAAGLPAGDDLGNHVATTTLTASYGIAASTITASTMTLTGFINVTSTAGYAMNGYTILRSSSSVTFVGHKAGWVNTTGGYNTAAGYRALYSNTEGYSNTATGADALYANITGDFNTATGLGALYANTDGGFNTANGAWTLDSNTTGGYNTAVGFGALDINTIGSDNTAIGVWALDTNTSGNYNTAIGESAFDYNTTGGENTAVGAMAGYGTKTGSANTLLGYSAGYGVANNSYSSNTLVGYQSGYGLTTGSDNIFLGYKAGYTVTTGTGNIVIGYEKTTPAVGTNNHLNIGGVLYGNLSNGNVGIGTNSPGYPLEVKPSGMAGFQVEPQAGYVSLRVNGVEVARLEP